MSHSSVSAGSKRSRQSRDEGESHGIIASLPLPLHAAAVATAFITDAGPERPSRRQRCEAEAMGSASAPGPGSEAKPPAKQGGSLAADAILQPSVVPNEHLGLPLLSASPTPSVDVTKRGVTLGLLKRMVERNLLQPSWTIQQVEAWVECSNLG